VTVPRVRLNARQLSAWLTARSMTDDDLAGERARVTRAVRCGEAGARETAAVLDSEASRRREARATRTGAPYVAERTRSRGEGRNR
jgi:hypothetical protein